MHRPHANFNAMLGITLGALAAMTGQKLDRRTDPELFVVNPRGPKSHSWRGKRHKVKKYTPAYQRSHS